MLSDKEKPRMLNVMTYSGIEQTLRKAFPDNPEVKVEAEPLQAERIIDVAIKLSAKHGTVSLCPVLEDYNKKKKEDKQAKYRFVIPILLEVINAIDVQNSIDEEHGIYKSVTFLLILKTFLKYAKLLLQQLPNSITANIHFNKVGALLPELLVKIYSALDIEIVAKDIKQITVISKINTICEQMDLLINNANSLSDYDDILNDLDRIKLAFIEKIFTLLINKGGTKRRAKLDEIKVLQQFCETMYDGKEAALGEFSHATAIMNACDQYCKEIQIEDIAKPDTDLMDSVGGFKQNLEDYLVQSERDWNVAVKDSALDVGGGSNEGEECNHSFQSLQLMR